MKWASASGHRRKRLRHSSEKFADEDDVDEPQLLPASSYS
jgi:hypothetical protein